MKRSTRFRNGEMIIVVDDEDRENEGDLTVAAEKVTPDVVSFMVTHGRGLVCVALTEERLDRARSPADGRENTSQFETAFTVTIDAKGVTTTGVSAADRAATILARSIRARAVGSRASRPRPPLKSAQRRRAGPAGQTEAAVDLARIAGCIRRA